MTFTVSPWLVWAGTCLALFGAVWLARSTWREIHGAAGWLADWLQGRIDPPWWWKPWLYRFRGGDQDAATEGEELPPLPPERTWEQMTSHQLPLEEREPGFTEAVENYERGFTDGAQFVNRAWSTNPPNMIPTHLEERLVSELERQGWFDADVQARLRAEHEARRMSPAERKDWQRRERNRKRQAKRAEMMHRAHYAAMGLDYPSGLMARVRELAP